MTCGIQLLPRHSDRLLPQAVSAAVPLAAALVLAFVLSLLFFDYNYLALFHSDSAAMQVLAAAMAAEAPARALLVVVPLLLVVLIRARFVVAALLGCALGLALLAGSVIDAELTAFRNVAGLPLGLATPPEVWNHVRALLAMIWGDYLGTGHFRVTNDALFYRPFTGLKCLFLVAAPLLMVRFRRQPVSAAGFLYLAGASGALVGLAATALLIKSPDIRHFLWSLELCKLGTDLLVWQSLEEKSGRAAAAAGLCLLAAGLSAPIVTALYPPDRARLAQIREEQFASPPRQAFAEIMARYGIHRVYGNDFWQILRLEVLFPPAEAGVLGVWDGGIGYSNWLTRPSLGCALGTVLYWLGPGEGDRKIAEAVLGQGGTVALRSGAQTLYAGPPVWQRPDCSSIGGR